MGRGGVGVGEGEGIHVGLVHIKVATVVTATLFSFACLGLVSHQLHVQVYFWGHIRACVLCRTQASVCALASLDMKLNKLNEVTQS